MGRKNAYVGGIIGANPLVAPTVFASSDPHTFDDGVYRYHEFTSDGTLTVTSGGTFDVLLVGGGGAGGYGHAGGGAGGEVVIGTGLTMTDNGSITVTVGAGGSLVSSKTAPGGNGSLSTITSSGLATPISAKVGQGGRSRNMPDSNLDRTNVSNTGGGSDGFEAPKHTNSSYGEAGFADGNTSGYFDTQGNPITQTATGTVSISSYTNENGGSYTIHGGNLGGIGSNMHSSGSAARYAGGAGGAGAGADGINRTGSLRGHGGDGVQVTGWGSTDYYYGGGGGGAYVSGGPGSGGDGGGGGAAHYNAGGGSGGTGGRSVGGNGGGVGGSGGANTGGGGGAGKYNTVSGGSGGSGIVVIRYAI